MDGYEVNLYYSPEDGYYIAGIAEFVGCITDGLTAEEALANLREVKAAWIAAMRRQGHSIPSPRHHSALAEADAKTPIAA